MWPLRAEMQGGKCLRVRGLQHGDGRARHWLQKNLLALLLGLIRVDVSIRTMEALWEWIGQGG